MSIYLDIETSFDRRITVIGFYSKQTGLVQRVAPKISRRAIDRVLPRARKLFTFNGHCFDLPVIRKELDLCLRSQYESHDLRFIGNRMGFYGGLKAVEKQLGIRRELPDMDGWDAMRLWSQYQNHDDQEALKTLLLYNKEDVMNLILLRKEIERMGASARAGGP